MDEYADILSEIRAEKGIQKVPSVQEPFAKTPVETETGWYDDMIDQSKKAGELISESEVKLPEEKPQISPLLSPVLAAPEIVGQLAWGMASWVPSKLTGLGQIGLQKMSNAIFKSESENLQRTPEERAQFKTGVYSPERIRELADQAEAWWHIMPEPATKEAKVVLEKVGKGLDWFLSPFKIADEYYTKKGYPSLGYALRFIGEGLYFKGLHGVKTTTTPKLKALRKKLIKKAPINEVTDRLEGVLDEIRISKEPAAPEGDALKRVTKSQKIKAHKIQREQGLSKAEYMEIAERLTGETSIKDMNKASAGEFIKELKKGKKALRPELEPVKEIKEVEKVREIDTAESLAKEFDLRYMGKMENLELYSMKVPEGETTLATKGVSREALVKRIEEVREQFKIEKVKEEITEPIIEKPEEVKDAEEVRREVREAGEKERIVEEEAERLRVRDVERDRLEARAREAKEEIVEEPISEIAAHAIADDIGTLEDMGFYAEVSEMLGEGMKAGTIMKELKQKPYYKEDMADFGYTEKDIRSAIRAAKTEIGDMKAVREIEAGIEKERVGVERIEKIEIEPKMSKNIKSIYNEIMSELPDYIKRDIEVESIHVGVFPAEYRGEGGRTKIIGKLKEPEKYQIFIEKGERDIKETLRHELLHTYILKHPERLKTADGMFSHEKAVDLLEKESVGEVPLERVDPITGRPPGMERAFERLEKLPDEIREQYLLEQQPLTGETGKVLKTKFAAERRAKDLGKVGELVENPKGEGWLIKESREERVRRDKAEAEQWEEILKEEEGELRPEEERVDIDVDTFADIVKGERGAITFHSDSIKKLKKLIKRGLSRDEIIAGLKQKGATDKDIAELFSAISVRIPIGESKWLKKGQSPLEFLPARTVGKTKEGKILKAPAVTREDAHIVATTTDISSRYVSERWSIEAATHTFTRCGKSIRELFWRKGIKTEKQASDHAKKLLKESKKRRRRFLPFSPSSDRIGIASIAAQPDGLARLTKQGITRIPKLRPKELRAQTEILQSLKSLYNDINRVRKLIGEESIPPVENYTPWFNDMYHLYKLDHITLFDNLEKINKGLTILRKIPSQIDKLGRVPGLRGHERLRAGPDTPGNLELDIFKSYDRYVAHTAKFIHQGEALAYMHELLDSRFGLAKKAPNMYAFLRNWIDYQKGPLPHIVIKNLKLRKMIRIGNRNMIASLIAFNTRTALITASALKNSLAVVGPYHMGVGLSKIFDYRQLRRAARESNILTVRTPDATIYEAMGDVSSLLGRAQVMGIKIGTLPLNLGDQAAAYLTWLGAESKGKMLSKTTKGYSKLTEAEKISQSKEFSRNLADDWTTGTQASAARTARAPIQQHLTGQTITNLQTFTINNLGFIAREVMGMKNPDITKPEIARRVIRFLVGWALVDYFYEDVVGIMSPEPSPGRAYKEKMEVTGDQVASLMAIAKELTEWLPIVSGRLKFRTEVGGTLLSELFNLAEGDMTAVARLGGITGSQMVFKAYRAEKGGGTGIDILLGRYPEPSKGSAPSLIRGGDLVDSIGSP